MSCDVEVTGLGLSPETEDNRIHREKMTKKIEDLNKKYNLPEDFNHARYVLDYFGRSISSLQTDIFGNFASVEMRKGKRVKVVDKQTKQ